MITSNDKPSELPDKISEKEALGLMINLMKDLQAQNEKLQAELKEIKFVDACCIECEKIGEIVIEDFGEYRRCMDCNRTWVTSNQLNKRDIAKLQAQITFRDEYCHKVESELIETRDQLKVAMKALKIIEDISSAFKEPRKTSYSDWELRHIARQAIEQIGGENEK